MNMDGRLIRPPYASAEIFVLDKPWEDARSWVKGTCKVETALLWVTLESPRTRDYAAY